MLEFFDQLFTHLDKAAEMALLYILYKTTFIYKSVKDIQGKMNAYENEKKQKELMEKVIEEKLKEGN